MVSANLERWSPPAPTWTGLAAGSASCTHGDPSTPAGLLCRALRGSDGGECPRSDPLGTFVCPYRVLAAGRRQSEVGIGLWSPPTGWCASPGGVDASRVVGGVTGTSPPATIQYYVEEMDAAGQRSASQTMQFHGCFAAVIRSLPPLPTPPPAPPPATGPQQPPQPKRSEVLIPPPLEVGVACVPGACIVVRAEPSISLGVEIWLPVGGA